MRIKKISSNKIVVQLTDSDLKQFDLDFENKIPQAADLHNFLFEVMEVVQSETGFDPYHGGQVIVEASPSEEGISLLISKIKTENKAITRDEFKRAKGVRVKASSGKGGLAELDPPLAANGTSAAKNKGKRSVFLFDGFEDVEGAMAVLAGESFAGVRLYRNEKKYAVVSRLTAEDRVFNVLSEYAAKTVMNNVCAYDVAEGWTLVAEGDGLGEMALHISEMI